MRYCPGCHRLNEGWPERCRFCASTWGVRICRRGHPNPVDSVFCGQCGSAEMSEATRGGWFLNRIFRLFNGDHGWFRYLVKIALVLFVLLILIKNVAFLAPFLIAIGLLVAAFRLLTQQLPGSLLGFLGRLLRFPSQQRKTKPKSHDRRG